MHAATIVNTRYAQAPVSPLGQSAGILRVRELIRQVAPHATMVLIRGESGSGKEVVARAIHDASPRAGKPFVPVNCGAIPADLLESELFGHEKGSFTGAIATRKGRFEMAEGGTLFLDEIGDMSLPMQVKILRVLQERCFERVGSNQTIYSNVRIIAATHRDLDTMVELGTFRQDLYFRLNVFPIMVPPLRERGDDLPRLIAHFNDKLNSRGQAGVRFSPGAMDALGQYAWPGNIRELENLCERLSITHGGRLVKAADLPPRYCPVAPCEDDGEDRAALLALSLPSNVVDLPVRRPEADLDLPEDGFDLKQHLNSLELHYIAEALRKVDGVVSRAARLLGLQRTTLVEKMKKLGLQAAC